MVGGVEGFRQRDEVEEGRSSRGRYSEMTPAWAIVQRRRQDSECGDGVKKDRYAKPEERHGSRYSVYPAAMADYCILGVR